MDPRLRIPLLLLCALITACGAGDARGPDGGADAASGDAGADAATGACAEFAAPAMTFTAYPAT